MASAISQDEMLSLVGLTFLERMFSQDATRSPEEVMLPVFLTMNHNVKKRCVEILTEKLFIDGQADVRVSVKDFQGNLIEWNKLLAQLTAWNFEDFFTWQASVREKEIQPQA